MSKSSSDISIGELMWAKIGSYPYWPCIVSGSPGTNTFQKSTKKGSLVHVHFFGDNGKHSWVFSSALMPFKGLDEFNKLKFKSNDLTKITPGFNVKNNLKSSWDNAVKEIETVEKKDINKRLDEYYVLYPLKYDHGGSNNKRKSVTSDEDVPTVKIVKETKVIKTAPPKKAIKEVSVDLDILPNGTEENKSTKSREVLDEPVHLKSKKTEAPKKIKTAPPKKAIKEVSVDLDILPNGTEENKSTKPKSEPTEVPDEQIHSKSKKTETKKDSKKKQIENRKLSIEESSISKQHIKSDSKQINDDIDNNDEDEVEEELDVNSVLNKMSEYLSVVVVNKKQIIIAKKLIENILNLGVKNQLTDKHDIKK